jgi:hypothetical protein
MLNLDELKQMIMETEGGESTLSLYLDVDPGKQENQSTQPAWRIILKDILRDVENQHKSGAGWQAIKERFDAFFESYNVNSKGLGVFFTPTSERIYELPVPVESRWAFGKPLIAPLLWAIDEYEPYLIVMVDQEKAELLTMYLGSAKVEDRLESDLESYEFKQKTLMPSGAQGITEGSNRDAFQSTINAHVNRFHREVVQHIEELVKKNSHIRIIVGGEEQAAHAVYDLMPQHLTDTVVKVMPIPMRSNQAQVMEQVLPVATEYEREQEMNLVDQVIDFAKAGGRGALGRKAVEEALVMQRVETLILPWPATDDHEATDLAARAFASGGAVELVHGAAAARLKEEGGIAARLYYTLQK